MEVEYKALECDSSDLNPTIEAAALEGWLIHTFQSLAVRGHTGTDTVRFYVLLQRAVPEKENDEQEGTEEGGIPMRG